MPKISFDAANVSKCICTSCPVQSESQCVSQQRAELKDALKRNPLTSEAVPALYCASGTASCQDIDFHKDCICTGCPVYFRYRLKKAKPVLYFCRDGASR
ncbi:MAG: DUF2769 domain-containing protein [Chloroflexi bacterium]|nr:DUF2769 domain-containing protein [Chloroflexota bacterium]